MPPTQPRTWTVLCLGVFTLSLFLVDMTIALIEPLITPHIGYIVIVVLAGRLLPRHYTLLFSGFCTVCALLGLQLSLWPLEGATSIVVMNRILVIVLLWIITGVIYHHQSKERSFASMPKQWHSLPPEPQDQATPSSPVPAVAETNAHAEQLMNPEARTATFVHEVNNLLHRMSLSAQVLDHLLRDRQDTVDVQIKDLVYAQMMSLKRLKELLTEFRTDSALPRVVLQPIALRQLIDALLAREKEYYQKHGVAIEDEIPRDLPLVLADGAKMEQVLRNLCQNATEAMPNGGTLRIRAQQQDGHVCLQVSDTGVGVPPGVDITAPFVTTKPEGSGLGLPIVQQIVAAHHGTLTYQSTPGTGATFNVLLPTMSATLRNGTQH